MVAVLCVPAWITISKLLRLMSIKRKYYAASCQVSMIEQVRIRELSVSKLAFGFGIHLKNGVLNHDGSCSLLIRTSPRKRRLTTLSLTLKDWFVITRRIVHETIAEVEEAFIGAGLL